MLLYAVGTDALAAARAAGSATTSGRTELWRTRPDPTRLPAAHLVRRDADAGSRPPAALSGLEVDAVRSLVCLKTWMAELPARSVAPMWRSLWESPPPLMERSLRDDVKAACGVLLGAALGVLIFDPGHPQRLVVLAVAAVLFTAILNVVRRSMRRSDDGACEPDSGAGAAGAGREHDG